MAARQAAKLLLPQLRGLRTSTANAAGAGGKGGMSHGELVHGDGHHGLRPGYPYDWEHGPHYLRPDLIKGFTKKYAIFMPVMFVVGFGIPVFAVWYQQQKLKT